MNRVLLGGTFDPPHIAHLMAGEAAYNQMGVDVVTFIPAGSPWQKAADVVTAPEHRWAMTRLAVDGVDYFQADDREVRRDGPTYTIDTIESFSADDTLTLILGADAAANLRSWRRWSDVLARVRVAVVGRAGTDDRVVNEVLGDRVTWLDMPRIELSGTEIRRRASSGRSVRFLVRDNVWDYITENRIYQDAPYPGSSV